MKGTIGIVGPKRMDYDKVVETLLRTDGLGHRVNHPAHNIAVDPRLLLHDRYHGQVDLVNGETVQVGIQGD